MPEMAGRKGGFIYASQTARAIVPLYTIIFINTIAGGA